MSKLIYLVDDNEEVLEMLTLLLSGLDSAWEIIPFSEPAEAISAAGQRPPNLVLSDQDMPQMSGTQMLEAIRLRAPAAVRIIVSGHGFSLDKLSSAHQYLAKPLSFQEVKRRIQQAMRAQERLQNPQLRSILTQIQSLPVIPKAYLDVVRELENPNGSYEMAAELIASDGGIMTKLLLMANSPLFGHAARINDAKEALLLLGSRRVLALVLSLHIFRGYEQLRCPDIKVANLWRHSSETARLARQIFQAAGMELEPTNDVFFAGLIHDLGKLVLLENFPVQYREVVHLAKESNRPLTVVEREVFTASHSDLCGFLLCLWGMNEAIVEAVTYQDRPWESNKPDAFSGAVALYLASYFARKRYPPDALPDGELNNEYINRIGCSDHLRFLEQSCNPPTTPNSRSV